ALSQGFSGAWRVSTSIAAQEQDRRPLGWPRGIIQAIGESETENLTCQYSIGLHKAILHRQDFKLELGMMYALENNRFSRPFNHNFFTQDIQRPLLYVDNYQVHQLIFPVSLRLRLFPLEEGGCLFAGADLLPSVSLLKTESRHGLRRWQLDPYALEINPGLGFRWRKWEAMLSYRALHRRTWDEGLFSPSYFNPPFSDGSPPTQFDQFNPHKIWLSVSYDLAGIGRSPE
ncbi:MAG: hypothetical protein AAF804_11805, partial [Bacteroidota bacterium]